MRDQQKIDRKSGAVFSRHESGYLLIKGKDRFSWLQGMVSNDVRRLQNGETNRLRACILNATGHLLANITLFSFVEDTLLMEIPLPQTQKIYEILDRFLIMEDVELEDVSRWVSSRVYLGLPSSFHEDFSPASGTTETRNFPLSDYGGEGSESITLFDRSLIPPIPVGELLSSVEDQADVRFTSENEREAWRVEAGIPKWGNELDERVIPLEANLGETHFSFTKGCYVGQEIIARIDSRGHTNRALTGLLVKGNVLPEKEDKLFTTDEEAKETGRITSVVAESPALGNHPIALGFVRHEHRAPGTQLKTEAGVTLIVTGLPFYGATPAT